MGKSFKMRMSIIKLDPKLLKYSFVILGIIICVASMAHATNYTFIPIEAPDGSLTEAYGINNSDNIVGINGQHGFLYIAGTFTWIDFPGAWQTQPYGINDFKNIVGAYLDADWYGYGFLYYGGNFTPINFPAASETYALGINNSNHIVGHYRDTTSAVKGFIYADGVFTSINYPDASLTVAFGINNSGSIVGCYRDAIGRTHGFLYEGGTFSSIDFPGASETYAIGINNSGDLVGWFTLTIQGPARGFLYSGGSFTTIDFPGASQTIASGINDSTKITGFYFDATGHHGFLASPWPISTDPTYGWHTFYGSSNYDFSYASITTDGTGNVYLTGGSSGTWDGPAGQSPLHAYSGHNDVFVLKLDSNGSYQWHTFYGSSISDMGYGIATDGSGNVYVTGESDATWNGPAGQNPLHAQSGSNDIFVLKLDSNGSYQWHTFYGSGSSYMGGGYGITTDGSGNVYISGYGSGTWDGPAGQSPLHAYSGNNDIFVLKLDSNGSYQWHTFYGGPNDSDEGYAVATDESGSVYVTGGSLETWNGPAGENPLHAHSGGADIFVLKLDGSGSYQWHTFYGLSSSDIGDSIATNGRGSIYVTGFSATSWNGPVGENPLHAHSAGNYDVFVLKLDSSGSYQWHTFYGSTDYDYGLGICEDGSGNVYISGESDATWDGPAGQNPLHAHSGGADVFALKLDGNGSYQWHAFYGSSYADLGGGIATDGRGSIYVAGFGAASWNGPAGESPLHAYSGNTGIYDVYVLKLVESFVCNEPSITSQPKSQTILSGKTAILSVSASGTMPFSYQWYQGTNGDTSSPITGATADTYTTPPLTQTTDYWVRVTNSCGSADSNTATVTVTSCTAPSISSQPQSQTILSGQTASMSVSASGTPPLSYQWYQGSRRDTSNPIPGATADIYTTPSLTQTTNYWVRVSNACGGTDSNTATVTVAIVGISVASPNGGEGWPAGSMQTIRWNYIGNPGTHVKIELLKGGVPNRTITSSVSKGTGGNGSYDWTISSSQSLAADYRIRVTSTSNGTYTDTSDRDFTIAAPTITVVSPDGGETWAAGSTQTISWSYTGSPRSYVKIELLKGGVFSRVITSSCLIGSGGSGSYAWVIPTSQAGGSDYQVRVTSTTNSACTDTSNSTFTITGPLITVTSPNGGENWAAGTTQTIRWSYTGNPGSYVKIELLKGGVLNRTIVSSVSKGTNGSGSYNWVVPSTQTDGSDYQVRVTSTSNSACIGTSNGNFTITGPPPPSITVTSPNGGETWAAGTSQTISWSYTGSPGSYVKIELLKGGVLNRVITSSCLIGSGGSGSYAWVIPTSQAGGSDYQVRVTSTTNTACTDTGNGNFTITGPLITLTSPNGGENWAAGSTQTIQWTYIGNPGSYVRIELLKGGVLNRTIVSSVSKGTNGSGSYNWVVPSTQIAGSDYQVRVRSTTNSACTDTSNGNFTITGPLPPSITVTSPNGGETWAAGTTQTISWSYTGNLGSYVKVELLKSGVLNRTIINSCSIGTAGSGSYPWSIPSTQTGGSDYQVRVTSTSNSTYADSSDSNFTITGPPPPTISVVSPNGGESWAVGTRQTIRWSYSGSVGSSVKIELLKAGVVNRTITSSALVGKGGSASYNFSIPYNQAVGSDYSIRVTSTSNNSYSDTSDSNFTIDK